MENRYVTDQQQVLADMARAGVQNRQDTSAIVSAGGSTRTWAVKIKSHVDHNVYLVCAVVIGDTGSTPVEFGEQVEATNLAESFLSQGTLSAGTYAVLHRLGEKNVFYAVP
jgi:hypothetical protein